jgi:hypothetical protein
MHCLFDIAIRKLAAAVSSDAEQAGAGRVVPPVEGLQTQASGGEMMRKV